MSYVCADLLQITIWLTPAGTVDNGGVEQPAYLNFDVALLGPPSGNQMEVRVPLPCASSSHAFAPQPLYKSPLASRDADGVDYSECFHGR